MNTPIEYWADMPVLVNNCVGEARAWFLLAHGAGASMDSDFMEAMAQKLAGDIFTVVRFEFPYMQQRRTTGKKSPPNRMPRLLEHWREVLEIVAARTDLPLVVGGKSMGGRSASLVMADEQQQFRQWRERLIAGVCFGYPFHPPAKTDNTRVEHLKTLRKPLCIFHGTRDPFGKPEEVSGYSLSKAVSINWLESGDHDFKPLKRSGLTQGQLIGCAAAGAGEFVNRCLGGD